MLARNLGFWIVVVAEQSSTWYRRIWHVSFILEACDGSEQGDVAVRLYIWRILVSSMI